MRPSLIWSFRGLVNTLVEIFQRSRTWKERTVTSVATRVESGNFQVVVGWRWTTRKANHLNHRPFPSLLLCHCFQMWLWCWWHVNHSLWIPPHRLLSTTTTTSLKLNWLPLPNGQKLGSIDYGWMINFVQSYYKTGTTTNPVQANPWVQVLTKNT